jgi:predicted RNA-binding protein
MNLRVRQSVFHAGLVRNKEKISESRVFFFREETLKVYTNEKVNRFELIFFYKYFSNREERFEGLVYHQGASMR